MLLNIRNEALSALRFECWKIVRHISGQQHISLRPSHQEARVSYAMSRRGESEDRAVSRNGPAAWKARDVRSVEVEHIGHEASVHGRHQRAKQTSWQVSNRSPLRSGDPYALRIECREPTDVIPVKMRKDYAVEVAGLQAAPRKLVDERLFG